MTIDALRLALADRYRIERELGQGGMATVYLGPSTLAAASRDGWHRSVTHGGGQIGSGSPWRAAACTSRSELESDVWVMEVDRRPR